MSLWRLEQHDELGSTSDEILARAAAGAPAGLAILAHRQTGGRGSRGRGWTAPAGNLNLSVLLRPARPAAEAGFFSLLAGIAVAEALAGLGAPPLQLKWPNDVLLDGAKLAGILIEAAPRGAALEWLSIGIGVNLREAPQIPDRRTTALAAHGPRIEALTAATAILDRLGAWAEAPAETIRAAWLARAHPPGTALRVAHAGRVVEGRFAGLTAGGALRLAVQDRIEEINTGDVLLAAG